MTSADRTPANGKPGKQSTGTAFAVSAKGHALTNHHIVDGCTEVKVTGREGLAKVITSDSVNDIALLQLAFENARFDGNVPLLWLIYTTGRRMVEGDRGLAGVITATLAGLGVPEQADALASIAVCQANLGHAEMLFSAAAGLRNDPVRRMQVGRQQQESSRLVAAASGVNPAA